MSCYPGRMADFQDYLQNSEDDHQERRRIGSNVRFLRQEKGLKQSELAEEMQKVGMENWYQTTVSRVERGSQALTGADVIALSKVLGGDVIVGTALDATLKVAANNLASREVKIRLAYLEEAVEEFQKVIGQLRELVGDDSRGDD